MHYTSNKTLVIIKYTDPKGVGCVCCQLFLLYLGRRKRARQDEIQVREIKITMTIIMCNIDQQ